MGGDAIIVFTQTQSPWQNFFVASGAQSLHGVSQGGILSATAVFVAAFVGTQAAKADAAGATASVVISARLMIQFAMVRASNIWVEAYYTSSALGHR